MLNAPPFPDEGPWFKQVTELYPRGPQLRVSSVANPEFSMLVLYPTSCLMDSMAALGASVADIGGRSVH